MQIPGGDRHYNFIWIVVSYILIYTIITSYGAEMQTVGKVKAKQTSKAAEIILAFLLSAAPTALKFLSRISA